eukprot:3857929-Amphidinium_carterae.2
MVSLVGAGGVDTGLPIASDVASAIYSTSTVLLSIGLAGRTPNSADEAQQYVGTSRSKNKLLSHKT